ncbi:hypothetical protein RSWS8N_20644 (plasmid) [Cereibacter sphaeroides WS8N]|uniref:hypothetical protein n=1 Tax=Cereibacter sphaeroides TaxID=1063 RepID=UPI00020B02B3|nr:hypothetical protein [Cereibacter sphaeroides]EGJ19308.1 hypothetical protein RSWS8N_20644 [Cereibacter sphaeroides WS8N]
MDLDSVLIDLLSDQIVAELKTRTRRGLLLFAETDLALAPALASINALRQAGWSFDWAAASAMHGTVAEAMGGAETARLGRPALVVVPTLSLTLAAKVACGIADDPLSALMAEALDRGLRIVAARDGVCPAARERVARGLVPRAEARRALMRGYLEALAAQGVELCWAERLDRAVGAPTPARAAFAPRPVPAPPEPPVQRAGVFGWQQARTFPEDQLRLGRAVRVTPLAADILSARGICLTRE